MTEVQFDTGGIGSSPCFVSDSDDGRKIFRKSVGDRPQRFFYRVDRGLREFLVGTFPLRAHMINHSDPNDLVGKEVRTWKLWKDAGIPVLDLVSFGDREVCYCFLEGATPYSTLLRTNSPKEFDLFLQTYTQIRALAYRTGDVNCFHSDPHLGNFLYSPTRNVAVPIDPAISFNPDLSFEEVDLALNLYVLASLASLPVPENLKRKYLSRFKEILGEEDCSSLAKRTFNSPTIAPAYLGFREFLAHVVRRRALKPSPVVAQNKNFMENWPLIQRVLSE